MGLVSEDWLKYDRHAKMLIDQGLYTAEVIDTIDSNVIADFDERGVAYEVDGNGNLTSKVLRRVAVDYALFILLGGNWGVVDSDKEIFRDKASYHEQQYRDGIASLPVYDDTLDQLVAVVAEYCNQLTWIVDGYDNLPLTVQVAVRDLQRDYANRTTGVSSKTSQGIVVESYTSDDFSAKVKILLQPYRSMRLS